MGKSWCFFFIVSGMMLSSGFRRKTMLITHQCFSYGWAVLYRAKDIPVSQFLVLSCKWRWLRGHKELGWDRSRTADLNWPKGYSIPYNILQKPWKMVGTWPREKPLLRDRLGIGEWWAIALCITCFVYVYIYTITIILFFFSLYFSDLVFYLNLRVLRFFFFWFSPPSHWEGSVSERLCHTEQPARLQF